MHPILLVLIFIVATIVGYLLIKNVPSLLHTPLMSGMNALSGITVLGALAATGAAVSTGSKALGFLAIFLAMLNVAGGFGVTHRMLRMFRHKREKEGIRNE
ncbi:MAG: NAD(P) transhydrogenase subunit alpha [Clostridiales bacterium]|uniref:NAD(P) transhydrogenase subunit alpha n=1 Tax=Candidatus Fimivicinus sp. TaxID=3056640 RepID=UPI001D596EC7|nr:NAD(P) transhydrogenase subunit alpha [Clostridiales bacterium]